MTDYLRSVFVQRNLFYFCAICLLVIAGLHWQYRFSDLIRTPLRTVSDNISHPVIRTQRQQSEVTCDKLLAGNKSEIKKAVDFMKKNYRRAYMEEVYPSLTENCTWYKSSQKYITNIMDEGEKQFPLAFSMLVFQHAEQVESLLRAIWRPHNVYCIHIDQKSRGTFKNAIRSISKCFENVIVLDKSLNVRWGTYTVLEPEILCMEAMWRNKVKWKYFINLTGQEFPLKTNYELYKILQAYNGMNDIGGSFKEANHNRWQGKGSPPHGIKPIKGSVHIAASRGFVDYLLHNKTSLDLLEWLKPTGIPDETYFATLNFNPHLKVPGAYTGEVDDGKYEHEWTRYKIWYIPSLCSGKFSHSICIFSVGDLVNLTNAKNLFANKFHYDYHYLSYDCLEHWYNKKVEREIEGHLDFNTTLYKNRWRVTHHF